MKKFLIGVATIHLFVCTFITYELFFSIAKVNIVKEQFTHQSKDQIPRLDPKPSYKIETLAKLIPKTATIKENKISPTETEYEIDFSGNIPKDDESEVYLTNNETYLKKREALPEVSSQEERLIRSLIKEMDQKN